MDLVNLKFKIDVNEDLQIRINILDADENAISSCND